jgi:hypothetical protein
LIGIIPTLLILNFKVLIYKKEKKMKGENNADLAINK